MQRICKNCNTLVTGEGSFCPSCGAPLPNVEEPKPQQAQAGYSSGDPHRGTMPEYGGFQEQKPVYRDQSEMTVGKWALTIVATSFFGFISLIFCISWAFSNNTPIEKKRYCQAMLWIQCVLIALELVFMIVFGIVLAVSGADTEMLFEAMRNSPV